MFIHNFFLIFSDIYCFEVSFLGMLSHAKWIDSINPVLGEGSLNDGNPARDSLRALLLLVLFALTFAACMVRPRFFPKFGK